MASRRCCWGPPAPWRRGSGCSWGTDSCCAPSDGSAWLHLTERHSDHMPRFTFRSGTVGRQGAEVKRVPRVVVVVWCRRLRSSGRFKFETIILLSWSALCPAPPLFIHPCMHRWWRRPQLYTCGYTASPASHWILMRMKQRREKKLTETVDWSVD